MHPIRYRPDAHHHPATPVSLSFGGWLLVIVVAALVAAATAIALLTLMPAGASNMDGDPRLQMRARAELAHLGHAVQAYRMRLQQWTGEARLPRSLEELVDGPPDFECEWQPLIDRVPTDPWGNHYYYRALDGDAGGFTIRSLGADGMPGGRGADVDLVWPEE